MTVELSKNTKPKGTPFYRDFRYARLVGFGIIMGFIAALVAFIAFVWWAGPVGFFILPGAFTVWTIYCISYHAGISAIRGNIRRHSGGYR